MSVVLRGVLSLLLFYSTQLTADEPVDEHFPLCEAYVYKDKAEFLFPVLDVDVWLWNRSDSPDKKLEYAWEVLAPAKQPKFNLGVYLFKKPGAQKEGKLTELLKDADLYAAAIEGSGKEARHNFDKDLKVNVHLEYDGVVLSLADEASVSKVFAGKPHKVIFNVVHPAGFYSIKCEAKINYRTAEQSGKDKPINSGQPDFRGDLP
jgi:hypothetical protein